MLCLAYPDEADDSGDDEAYARFNELIKRGKQYVGEGKIEEAVKCNKKALKISYSEKLARKIKKMEVIIYDIGFC